MSAGRWKALLIAVARLSATVMVIESVAAAAAFTRGTTGRLGIQHDAAWHDGQPAWVVHGFEPSLVAARPSPAFRTERGFR